MKIPVFILLIAAVLSIGCGRDLAPEASPKPADAELDKRTYPQLPELHIPSDTVQLKRG